MRKEEFDRRTREVKAILDNYYKDEKKVAYVLLLQVEAEEEGCVHESILSNAKSPRVVLLVHSIMRTLGSLIGRQN